MPVLTWDIFCSVVDNYGDIGVCWRLARQLSGDLGQTVRLWVDDLSSFQRIRSELDASRDMQMLQGVEVRHWNTPFDDVEPAAVVVEGFGVRLPDNYIVAMTACKRAPVWINLEHISAEPWVDGYHALPSPHPKLPLTKHFFFPGYTAATGGLLIERDLVAARDAFQADADAQTAFLRALGVLPADSEALCISLFCYDNAALDELVSAWSTGETSILCLIPPGAALTGMSTILGTPLASGGRVVHGRLTALAIPFLDVDDYDRLLWACDVNFVRGEDSFVRAQLAACPLVWQAYVQAENTHLAKQAAFVDRYLENLDAAAADALRALHDCWNRQSAGVGEAWAAFIAARVAAAVHAKAWADRLAGGGNLANKLAEFCMNQLK
ncbi:MAG: hypothetical protein JWN94_1258 [Betaproteobacteria bacterium]|nr:hypothetical protein [Betaproteobacteria bacterium]